MLCVSRLYDKIGFTLHLNQHFYLFHAVSECQMNSAYNWQQCYVLVEWTHTSRGVSENTSGAVLGSLAACPIVVVSLLFVRYVETASS